MQTYCNKASDTAVKVLLMDRNRYGQTEKPTAKQHVF